MRIVKVHLGWLVLLAVSMTLLGCDRDGCTQPDDGNHNGAPMVDAWPKWSSADSSKIAYTHVARAWEELQEYGDRSVWVVDIVTLEEQHITDGVVYDWSPHGDELLIWRPGGQMWLVNWLTGEEQLLPVRGQEADFSPCGSRIAFYGGEETTGTWVLYLESMTTEWISDKGGADWSPDGSKLLCDSLVIIGDDGTRIGKVDVDYQFGLPWLGRWSPVGGAVAYGAYCAPRDGSSGDVGIWVANIDGTNQRLVTCPGARASWAPDGKGLAFMAASPDSKASVIWTVGIDGSGKKQVTFP